MVACNFLIPFILLGIRRLRTLGTIAVSSVAVLIGMWLERFLIVIPTLSYSALPAAWGPYEASWVELSITAGTFAAMALFYMIFAKIFPIIAIWEYDEDVSAS